MERRLREAAGPEEAALVLERQPHAQTHPAKPAPARLVFGLADERSRDPPPSMRGMDRQAAEIQTVILLLPQHGTDDHSAALADRPTTTGQVIGDRRRRFVQGA